LKILQVHNHYKQLGGEDAVVNAENELLSINGHNVKIYSACNNDISGIWKSIIAAFQVTYSTQQRELLKYRLLDFRPDIVHIHNFFPLITPSVYDACFEAGIPVIQTLHNYRIFCPAALLMHNGKICNACITASPYRSVLSRCYRSSFLGTLAVARMVDYHKRRRTWQTMVNSFIALTEFSKCLFVQAGIPSEKIVVKPNFYDNRTYISNNVVSLSNSSSSALFIGRLSLEKGIITLLKSWEGIPQQLNIAGDGPLKNLVTTCNNSSVHYLGHLSSNDISIYLKQSLFLVMPSEWYETFGMVIIEAFAHGIPVIASNFGCMAELVKDGITGLHFASGNAKDLSDKILWAFSNTDKMKQMGLNARRVYEDKFTPTKNYQQLLNIYDAAIKSPK